jgi:hypothetical protein
MSSMEELQREHGSSWARVPAKVKQKLIRERVGMLTRNGSVGKGKGKGTSGVAKGGMGKGKGKVWDGKGGWTNKAKGKGRVGWGKGRGKGAVGSW